MYALEAKNVKKTYKSRKKQTEALKGLDLEVKEGEIFGILGPNGAGKTTFIKICSTLLGKTEGEVSVLGLDIEKDEKEIRTRIGYIGQDSERSTYARLTGKENLEFFAALYNMSKEERQECGLAGHEWATGEEAGLTAKLMTQRVVEGVDKTFDSFVPRKSFEFIDTSEVEMPTLNHELIY